MKNEHVVRKRCFGSFHKPCPNDLGRILATGNLVAGREAEEERDHAKGCQEHSHTNEHSLLEPESFDCNEFVMC